MLGRVRSIRCISFSGRRVILRSHETGCRVLLWGDAHIGRLRTPASISGPLLSTLRELYMEGPKICIHLPRSLQVYTLHLCAMELTITSEDPACLARGLRDVSFMYKALGEADAFEIAAAMAEAGKPMIRVPHSKIAHLESSVFDIEPDRPATYGIYYGACYFHCVKWPCACGACLECIGAL